MISPVEISARSSGSVTSLGASLGSWRCEGAPDGEGYPDVGSVGVGPVGVGPVGAVDPVGPDDPVAEVPVGAVTGGSDVGPGVGSASVHPLSTTAQQTTRANRLAGRGHTERIVATGTMRP